MIDKKGFLLMFFLLVLAGCMGFGSDRAQACTQGDNCRFYTGSQGVQIMLDRPPTHLYYHSADLAIPDGNLVEIPVRVRNFGASDSYGAVFLTGFGQSFSVHREVLGDTIDTGRMTEGCTFDLFGIGRAFSEFSFDFSCFGLRGGQTAYGSRQLDIRFEEVAEKFGWNIDSEIDVRIGQTPGGSFDFRIGLGGMSISNFYHGKILLAVIDGLDFRRFGGIEYRLRGDNPEFPGGGDDYKTFLVRIDQRWPSGQDEFRVPYQVKSCYAYTTFASPELCVDPNPFSGQDKVCRASRVVNLGTQGAPIAITTMNQVNTGRTVEMRFEVRNVGGGTVWDVGQLERCSPYFPETGSGRGYRDIVYIGHIDVEGNPVECNRRQIRLVDGRGEFTCTYDLRDAERGIGSAYVAPVRMELWYGYEQSINNELRVRRAS